MKLIKKTHKGKSPEGNASSHYKKTGEDNNIFGSLVQRDYRGQLSSKGHVNIMQAKRRVKRKGQK